MAADTEGVGAVLNMVKTCLGKDGHKLIRLGKPKYGGRKILVSLTAARHQAP